MDHHPNAPIPSDRTQLWLPLLRGLTNIAPQWLVWKNAESAFFGTGDIDAAAPPADWPRITDAFIEWALTSGVGPVVVCRHIPGGLNLIAVAPGSDTFLEMGVKYRRVWRGATLFVVDDLADLSVLDPRGFRRLRPGAEGTFKLLLNGSRRDGRSDEPALAAKHVREQIRADETGMRLAADLYGAAGGLLRRAAQAAAAGGWNRAAILGFEGWMLLRAMRHPLVLAARVRFRAGGRDACPVVTAILHQGRRIPGDLDAWLAQVGRDHEVHAAADPSGGTA